MYRPARSYSRDPRWLTARYPGTCRRCGRPIARGARAYYYPSDKSLYCDADGCGGACERDFRSMAMDEELYGGAY